MTIMENIEENISVRLRLPLSELVNFGVVEHLSIVTLGDYVREPDILVWPEADVVNFWYK